MDFKISSVLDNFNGINALKSSKVLIVLYGLCRGKGISKKSYKSVIIDPLLKNGNHIDCIHVIKSNPKEDASDIEQIEFSDRDKVFLVREEDLYDHDIYEYSKSFRDKHSDEYLSNRYLIHQLSKLNMATEMVDFNNYDIVILLRDDLFFNKENIDWDFVFYLINFGPVVSKWFWNGGASERFVVATAQDAYKIATRKNLAKASIRHFDCLNGEYLQKFTFDYYKLRPLAISLRFCRVRKNKKLYKEKYIYPIWRPKECYWVTKSMAFVMLLKIKFYFSRWSD